MSTVSAKDIAALCLHSPGDKYFQAQLQSTEHRLAILSNWTIPPGAKVLEIGCGQGDCTAVLAELVGPEGHITAVDPGPLNYGKFLSHKHFLVALPDMGVGVGSPFNLGQAQTHLSSGRLGSRIAWKQSDPIALLETDDMEYDLAVLVLCTWYFPSPAALLSTLQAVSKRVRTLCIAEWSLSSASGAGQTHILAALAQAALQVHIANSQSNIRTAMSPVVIKEMVEKAGWALKSETTIAPADHVLDGKWETAEVKQPEFLNEIDRLLPDERQKSAVIALRDATLASLDGDRLKDVKSMDIWCATFALA
ncbi:hypothetical protein EWM64_g2006 [Hericium alpestre]|uniref:Methyltransferase domain-containing protein n=1 Tax=Hericium alpestre TaxID=135208 RepID=A0A4Z0A7V6_9AGAM|nr:hypothetical protein EWM64_g2006 [Hericium alpestre]